MDQLTLWVKEAKYCRERAKKASDPAHAGYWLRAADFAEEVVAKLKAAAKAQLGTRS